MYTHDGEVLERPGGLDVLQRLLQVLELGIDLGLGLLCALDGLGLKGLDGLDLPADVVLFDLEGGELLLDVVDNGRVLEDLAVVGEVDRLRLLVQQLDLAAGVIVALLEGLQGLCRGSLETELSADFGPVDLEGCAALWVRPVVSCCCCFCGRVTGAWMEGGESSRTYSDCHFWTM